MKDKDLKCNLAMSTIYQFLSMLLPLITTPYVSRVLGVYGIGIYSYTYSYSMYVCLFGALGTASYGTREIARNRNDAPKRSQLFWEISCVSFLMSTICIVIWSVWIVINTKYRLFYLILTLVILGTMFDISWFYAGIEEFGYTIVPSVFFKILGVVLIFTLVNKPSDLWLYVLIVSSSVLLSNVTMWMFLPRFVDRISLGTIKINQHFRETWIYFVPTVATSIYTVLDKTLIGLITNDMSENGYYEQASKIVNMAKNLSFSGLNWVFQSRVSFLFAKEKHDEIKERILRSMDFILFAGFAMTFGMIGISHRFIPLFLGKGYDKTVVLLCLLAPLTVVIGTSNCLGAQYYNPAGLRAQSAKYIIIGSVVNLVLNIILIPWYKSVGAAIATLAAEVTITILYMNNCNDYFSFGLLIKLGWKKIIAGALMLVAVFLVGLLMINNWIVVIAQILVGALVYCGLLLLLNDAFVSTFKAKLINGIPK